MANEIAHVVVLMMENCSYDHMLGFSGIGDGLTGDEVNRLDPGDPASLSVRASETRTARIDPDPEHSFKEVTRQLFGSVVAPTPPEAVNSGFVASYLGPVKNDARRLRQVMQAYTPRELPVLTRLAREFTTCDRWFSSVPGPTWPNRFFVHCATSDGELKVRPGAFSIGFRKYKMRTIYESLEEAGHSWNIFYHDIPQAATLHRLWHEGRRRERFRPFDEFKTAAEAGLLPTLTFIEPRYIGAGTGPANDQHPPHDVRRGEELIADVYESLRNGPRWKSTLLIVTYDEHGGFYDHVPPPFNGDAEGHTIPNPDDPPRSDAFNFQRLGPRVPTILISPRIAARVDSTMYEHASIPATIKKLFNLRSFLTARDEAATTFEGLIGSTVRETPTHLERPSSREIELVAAERGERAENPDELTDLQASLLDLAAVLRLEEAVPRRGLQLELTSAGDERRDAAAFIQSVMAQLTR